MHLWRIILPMQYEYQQMLLTEWEKDHLKCALQGYCEKLNLFLIINVSCLIRATT